MGCSGSRPGKRSCYGLSVEDAPNGQAKGSGAKAGELGPLDNEVTDKGGSTSTELQELTEEQIKKKEKPIKGLSEMNLGDFIAIVKKTREKLALDRAKGYTPKTVDLKLGAHVAKLAEPSKIHASLAVDHLEPAAADAFLAQLKAVEGSQAAITLDIPLSSDKKATLNAGRVVGKIFLALDQPQIVEQIKGFFPSYLGKGRQLTKTESGESVVRMSLFFGSRFMPLDNLTMLERLKVSVDLGSNAPHSEGHVEQSAVDAKLQADSATDSSGKAEAVENGATSSSDTPATSSSPPSTPQLFNELPDKEELAVRFSLDTQLERLLVRHFHRNMAEAGFAPKAISTDDDDEESGGESQNASQTVTGLLALLALLEHVETTVRFEQLRDLFKGSQQLENLSNTAAQLAKVPGTSIGDLVVSGFMNAPEGEERDKAKQSYDDVVSTAKSCFAGFEGTYRVNILSDTVFTEVAIRGINPYPLLPTGEEIDARIKQRIEDAARRAQERAGLAELGAFPDSDFDDLYVKCTQAVRDPWQLVYPPVPSDQDWVNVWIDPTGPGNPTLKVRGLLVGVTADQTFTHFFDPDVRIKWDHFLGHCQTIKKFKDLNADICFSVFATPPSVANREFLEFRQVKRVSDGILVLARSCEHASVPVDPSRVRGTTVYSGYFFKTTRDEQGAPITIVTGILKQDLGGFIPSFMLSQLTNRVIAEWMNIFISSCLRTYSSAQYNDLLRT